MATGLGLVGSALLLVPVGATANPAGTGLVISEIYGNGGSNATAAFRSDFIELYNPTASPIQLTGLSLQHRTATSSTSTGIVPLNGTVPAGAHYLVKADDGGDATRPELPVPDAISTLPLANQGQVLLVDGVDPFVGTGNLAGNPGLVDMVGYGADAISFEGATRAPAHGATKSTAREPVGADTDNNGPDFVGATTVTPEACGCSVPGGGEMPIADIQGTGAATPEGGNVVTTQGVVTATYPQSGGLNGFYMQTPGTDATPGASDGIFVWRGSGGAFTYPAVGNHVKVVGTAGEGNGASTNLTQIVPGATGSVTVLATPAGPVSAVALDPWPDTSAEKEDLEGMLVDPQGNFTVTNNFAASQFGELGLATGSTPLVQPTQVGAPGSAAALAAAADNAARAITLDDGASTDYLATSNNSTTCGSRPMPCLTNGDRTPPYTSNTAPIRVGATGTFGADVILTQGGSPTASTYRFQPVARVEGPGSAGAPAAFANTRTNAPDADQIAADGNPAVKVASFNVLNYFTTLGDANNDNTGDGGCTTTAYDQLGDGNTVTGGCDQRGAWDAQDLARQRAKLVRAINALDADVVGLIEIENSRALGEGADEATQALVAALNAEAGAGTWQANPSSADLPPVAQMDVISNAIIYKPAAVVRSGPARALGELSAGAGTDPADEAFANAREPIAQTFAPVGGGEPFLVVVNHFKSKSSAGPFPGDADSGDGQGASNQSRVRQATALADWVPTIQGGVQDVLLLGDFNAYAQEDPMQVLYADGYTNLAGAAAIGEYSYSFAGLSGSLDHVLANASAMTRFTGADIWNINAVESVALEYSRFNYHLTNFHSDGPFRSSDHDPVVVGLTEGDPVVLVETDVAATMQRMTYGRAGSVQVTVGPDSATGDVKVLRGTRELGDATLTAGAATVTIAGNALMPGAHQLTVRYPGDAAHAPSEAQVPLTVTKAMPRLRVHHMPKKVFAKRTRATLVVRALATGATPVGRVEVRLGGKLLKAASLRTGSARLKLPKFAGQGKKTLRVRYLGSNRIRPVTDTFVLRVKRR
ncbi:MAG TPA: ExeM/NucH family extracellular endonuclease [Actinophytocola sp.]|nr:ExeM/NucH family extracellular endonuclease [Actinophytocola sp.]